MRFGPDAFKPVPKWEGVAEESSLLHGDWEAKREELETKYSLQGQPPNDLLLLTWPTSQ